MTERAEDLARLIVRENGKALPDARGEVAYAAEFFRWYAEEAVRAEGHVQTAPAGTNRILVLRQPIGVSILITPVELPRGDGDAQDRTGARGGMHRGPQARVRYAAHRAGDGGAAHGSRAFRRAWSTSCRRGVPGRS